MRGNARPWAELRIRETTRRRKGLGGHGETKVTDSVRAAAPAKRRRAAARRGCAPGARKEIGSDAGPQYRVTRMTRQYPQDVANRAIAEGDVWATLPGDTHVHVPHGIRVVCASRTPVAECVVYPDIGRQACIHTSDTTSQNVIQCVTIMFAYRVLVC